MGNGHENGGVSLLWRSRRVGRRSHRWRRSPRTSAALLSAGALDWAALARALLAAGALVNEPLRIDGEALGPQSAAQAWRARAVLQARSATAGATDDAGADSCPDAGWETVH